MKKICSVFLLGLLLSATTLFAADGDLIVQGKLGIGMTTSPAVHLEVNSGIIRALGNANPAAPTSGTGLEMFYTLNSDGGRILAYNRTSSVYKDIFVGINSGSQLTLKASGNVGIGTSDPFYQLHLSTDSAAKLGTSTWAVTSDGRLKQDVQPYNKGLNEILQINPVSYRYNGKGGVGHTKISSEISGDSKQVETDVVDTALLSKTFVGVIAQEVQPVVPEAVSSHRGKIDNSDAIETDILDFDSHTLTFIMINAIKELKAQIDSLNQQLTDLRGGIK